MAFAEFAESIDEIATYYPDKQFCVYLVDISQFAFSNPGDGLVNYNVRRISEYAELANSLADSKNLVFLSNEVPSSENYHDYFYTTDHHWNGYGVERAYELIAENIGLDSQANKIVGASGFDGLVYNGSDSRIGLMLLDETINEPLFDFGTVKHLAQIELSALCACGMITR